MRACIPTDSKALAAFDRRTYPNKNEHAPPSYFSHRGMRTYWMLRNGRRVGACCVLHNSTFTPDPEALSAHAKGVLYITSTAILPKEQGRGLGNIFKAWQIAYARTHGFKKIVTNARKSNNASIRMNLKFGFTIVGESARCYPDGEDTVIMELCLTPSV